MAVQQLNVGVIGLGVMGRRMLERLAGHPRLRPSVAWDANPAACAAAQAERPGLVIAPSAEALIATPGLHSLYIATPPSAHMSLSEQGFDAGLAVFCEKPLTTDFAAAGLCIERIERERQRAAVNFALASSPGLATLQALFGSAGSHALGALRSVEIELGFAVWPRPWQAAAGPWLSERAEGGFSREVLSHFVFVLQRLLGPARVMRSELRWPADGRGAETALHAELQAAGVPVQVKAQVGGELADFNRMNWQATTGAIELGEWFSLILRQRGTGGWLALGEPAMLRGQAQSAQLDQWADLIEGRPQGLPGYAEALAVQQTIEALLRAQ
jgi:predicted dehydrogenase